jgi:hypothetical protein
MVSKMFPSPRPSPRHGVAVRPISAASEFHVRLLLILVVEIDLHTAYAKGLVHPPIHSQINLFMIRKRLHHV